jgi:DNA modification methylase
MLDFGYYNMDCMDGMKRFPDKYFDLAVVDVPYGIGESGDKNHTRGKLATAKDYKSFSGNDLKPPDDTYFKELFRVSKIRLYGAQTTLSVKFHMIAIVGLFGIRIMEKQILQTVN